MDYCSARKYSEYARSTHSMTSRVGVDAVLSGGPPNRMAPNVTVVPGHRHQQVLRYHEHQHRLATLHSSEGLYQHQHQHQQHQHQHQHHGFDRYLPPVSYSSDYYQHDFGAAGLGYGPLGRRHIPSAYINAHTPLPPHHLYHPAHYDNTYNGRMIGGGVGGMTGPSYHSYREGYDQQTQQQGASSSILHYAARTRNSAFQYGNTAAPASQQQHREYLQHYYPYHPSTNFLPSEERRYGEHNLHSINGLQVQSPADDDGRMSKKSAQHITAESEVSYEQQQQQRQQQQQQQQQHQQPSLSLMGITMIASPLTSGSTTTDSGISGSSRCGSTPISMVTTSASLSGDYPVNASISTAIEESCAPSEEYHKDGQEGLSEASKNIANEISSTKDQQFNSNLSSPHCESERTVKEKQCASNQKIDCPTSLLTTPERCGTPFISNNHHHSPSFRSPQHRYQYEQKKWSPKVCDTNEVLASNSPKQLSPKVYSPSPKSKRIYSPECGTTSNNKHFEEKKNRIVECDLIPNKKSKRKLIEAENVREEIRNIKPLPGFQQAFGSTEIGRFFETFRNIPTSPYAYESDFDTCSPQPWEVENSVDGSQYDVQISASLQTMYKSPLVDKKYLNGIRCNGY